MACFLLDRPGPSCTPTIWCWLNRVSYPSSSRNLLLHLKLFEIRADKHSHWIPPPILFSFPSPAPIRNLLHRRRGSPSCCGISGRCPWALVPPPPRMLHWSWLLHCTQCTAATACHHSAPPSRAPCRCRAPPLRAVATLPRIVVGPVRELTREEESYSSF